MKDNYEQAYTYRLKDAKALLGQERCEGAFYVGGYAVETVLKLAYEELVKSKVNRIHRLPDLFDHLNLGIQGKNIRHVSEKISLKCSAMIKQGHIKHWNPMYRYQGKLTKIYRELGDDGVDYADFIENFCECFLEEVEEVCLNLHNEIRDFRQRGRR